MTATTIPVDLAEAKAHVEAIVRRSKTSFFWAMRRLNEEKRTAMYAVYAFCREVDDIADDPGQETTKLVKLREWNTEIERLFDGNPTFPISQALEGPKNQFGLRKKDFIALIEGMEMDARDQVRIPDMETLELYCDRVACAVGRLSNRIFGVDEETGDRVANALGQALQLTNILRDVKEDSQRNRLYLPQDLLQAHGITITSDARSILTQPALQNVCLELADIAKKRFDDASTILSTCDQVQMRPAIMMMEAYRRIFRRLQIQRWQNFDDPVTLSKLEKLWVVLRYGIF